MTSEQKASVLWQLDSTNSIFLQGKHDFTSKTKLHSYRNSTVHIQSYKIRMPTAYLLRRQTSLAVQTHTNKSYTTPVTIKR
jgi:hypothetical protein